MVQMIVDNPMMTGYSVVKIDAPGAVSSCERCHVPLYKGDNRRFWHWKWICDECLEDAVRSMNADDMASEFDIETEEVE
jgi:alpha-beta hydrolase superfamily lysophospholipase